MRKAVPVIQLRTLGVLDLRATDGRPVRPILAQPKRFAILAYLALARPPGYHRRDTLLAIFWPDLDGEHARGALSRAIYFIRRSLGDRALDRNGGDDVGVSEGQIHCDALAFEAALDAGKLEDALALYRGDLLEGFFISDAPEFERWLEDERSRLRGRAAQAAATLATREERRGNLPLGLHWARRGAELAPYDEASFGRLARLLDRAGDRPAALLAYEAFARRLRDDLDLEPSAETHALMAEIRRREKSRGQIARADSSAREPLPAVENATQPQPLTRPHVAPGSRFTAPSVLLAVVAVAAAGIALRLIPSASAPDRNILAVLPFRVTGSPSLAYLREGMVDLLAAKLNGEGGPRAVDPRTVIGAWRRISKPDGQADVPPEGLVRLARQLRVGQVLTGSVVETSTSLVLDAHVLDVASNRPGPEALVQGAPDSLLTLVDRLVAQVLARGAGERESHLASLTTRSLPALKAYLAGAAAYRQGRYEEAVRYLQAALSLDSTFALAGASLVRAGNWIGDSAALAHGRAVAYAHCRRLSQVCATPDSTGRASLADQAALGEPAGPLGDVPETWYELADPRFHGGSALGGELRASLDHAAAEFRRALELDSAYAPALSHLVDYSVAIRDTAAVQSYATRYLAVDSAGDLADYVRWVAATMTADSAALNDLRSRMFRMRVWTLVRIVGESQLEGIGLDDRDRAGAVLRGRAGSPAEVRNIYAALHGLALNAGRPRAGVVAVAQWQELQPSRQGHDRRLVLDALYWGGDTTSAQGAVHRLSGYVAAPTPVDPRARAEQSSDVCALELWALARGDTRAAGRAIAQLRVPAPMLSSDPAIGGEPCAVLLTAMVSSLNNRADRRATLDRLDSLLATGPSWNADVQYVDFGNLVVARLREEQGDLRGALAAIRRRSYEWWMPTFLSTYLREEGRLAALTGDRAGAIRAYQHYLALRSNPEPGLRPEVDQVHTRLATLLGAQAR